MAKNDIFTEDTLNDFLVDVIKTREEIFGTGRPSSNDPFVEECDAELVAFVDEDFVFLFDGVKYDVSVYADKNEEVVIIDNCRVVNTHNAPFDYYMNDKKVDKTPYDDVFETILNCMPYEPEFDRACEY